MKKWMITSLLVLSIIAFTSLTYAWFTYVQRKSLVLLSSHEIEAFLSLNDQQVTTELDLKGLSYVSFEQEFLLASSSEGFNEVGLNFLVKIDVTEDSPILKVMLHLSNAYPELILLWIDEGWMNEVDDLVYDYHSYLKNLSGDITDKDIFLEMIRTHNQNVLQSLSTKRLKSGSSYMLQLVIWADFDQLNEEEQDLSKVYSLTLDFKMISGKGDFDDA